MFPNFSQFSISQRMIILIALAGSIAGLVAVGLWTQQPDMQVLFSNLAPDDAGAIVDDTPGLRLGVAEQWTRFATLQRGDDEIRDPYDERLESSITQLVAEYRFTERLGVGLYLPVIDRTFRRVTPSGSVVRRTMLRVCGALVSGAGNCTA